MLGLSNQFGTHRTALDVPQHGGQVIVVLQRKRLESSLPHVPGRAVMAMIPKRSTETRRWASFIAATKASKSAGLWNTVSRRFPRFKA